MVASLLCGPLPPSTSFLLQFLTRMKPSQPPAPRDALNCCFSREGGALHLLAFSMGSIAPPFLAYHVGSGFPHDRQQDPENRQTGPLIWDRGSFTQLLPCGSPPQSPPLFFSPRGCAPAATGAVGAPVSPPPPACGQGGLQVVES